MKHSSIRLKVRRKKVARLAAYSRQFTVKNINKTISPRIGHALFCASENTITNPFTGNRFELVNPHKIPSQRFNGVFITGYDWVPPKMGLWKNKKHPQPKPLLNCRILIHTTKKMSREEYMEKLVQHKLAKWERKNPKPADIFEKNIKEWEQERSIAEERLRDFVISIYDKLNLIGRFKINENKSKEELVAELKDINGDGHRVNDVSETAPLLKKAKEITNKIKKKNKNLVCTNLKDHKKQKGRIILPDAA